jgi:protein-S-isoprenylcysteine O-methyltransferase Ste14
MKELSKLLFRFRSFTPIPFIVIMLVYYNGNLFSWIVGGLAITVGEFIRIWGISYAGHLTRSTRELVAEKLITVGPFAHVRNPLYIGNILIYVGFGILSMALFPYLQVAAFTWFIIQYNLIIHLEEDFLESKFGDKYQNYKKGVNRFYPNFNVYEEDFHENINANLKEALKSELRTLQALASVSAVSIIIHLVKQT